MKTLTRLTTMMALVAMAAGCSYQIPETTFYTLATPPAGPSKRIECGNPTQNAVLLVQRFEVPEAFARSELVYRVGPHAYRTYPYQQWSARPDRLVTDQIATMLSNSGIVARVVTAADGPLPDYELTGELLAIEEVDFKDGWQARIAMDLALVRLKDERVVWRHSFDEMVPVAKKTPEAVVAALSQLLHTQIEDVACRMSKQLTTMAAAAD